MTDTAANVDNLLAQMSRGASVLSGWDAVLNLDEELVNQIFQAQFAQAARDDWKNITIAFCQLFPNPGGSGRLAAYTGVNLQLARPFLRFLGDNHAFVEVSFRASGRAGTAVQAVPEGFDPKKADPANPALEWDYAPFSDVNFSGEVPLSALAGSTQARGEMTDFVLDFPAGSFNSPVIDRAKDPGELRLQLKTYLQVHGVRYVINSIRTDLAQQIPQMAPKAFRINVVTTNQRRNVFQIFIATQNPPQRDLTVGVNEPIPDGYQLSVMFNRAVTGALGTSLMVQAWAFMQSNLVLPGRTQLALGPSFTPCDALILGKVAVDAAPAPSPSPFPPVPLPEERAMLNIQKTKQITPPGQPAFTAYGDDDDPNAWYVVPKVVWAVNPATGLPQFSLVKYNKTGGGVSGFCRFSVQLAPDADKLAALKAQEPGATTAQFDWIASKAVFTYTVAGRSTSVPAQPSNFGSQVVTFGVPLPDEAAIAAFENAFARGSGAGTFGIDYELAANTRLPAVTVVSSFNSSIAYQYQVHNRYQIINQYHSDTWGNSSVSQVSVYLGSYVTEMLNQSQAGTVTVTPGQGITPVLLQMVQDWAQLQLQKDVEQAVNTALALTRNPSSDFSMSSVASFTHTLKTSNVVPWYFTVQGTLPPFPADMWKQLSSEVNQQQLEVTVQLQADLAGHGVERVNASLRYGGGPEQVHTFAVGADGPWFVSLPGQFDGAAFKPGYQYKYDVVYAKPPSGDAAPPPLGTGWIDGASPVVNLGLVELGLLAVTFEAANIDWQDTKAPAAADAAPTVSEISVDWNWVPGAGGPVLARNLVLTRAQPSGTQTLRSAGPTNNQEYQYALTFLMSDGSKLHANGLRGNAPRQRISDPLSDVSFNVFPMYPADARAVVLTATFDDERNDIHLSKTWKATPTRTGSGAPTLSTDSFGPWNFKAVPANLNMATVVFSGTWVDKAGKMHKIPPTLVVANNPTLFISDTQRMVTAAIDASNVEFVPDKSDGVYRVDALVSYTPDDATSPGNPLSNAATVTFGSDTPRVQYYTTDSVDIAQTPTFWYQYRYTVTRNKGAATEVKDAWARPQSTVSTSLPVVPGQPPAQPQEAAPPVTLRAVAAPAHALSRDERTVGLLARHLAFADSVQDDALSLLAR